MSFAGFATHGRFVVRRSTVAAAGRRRWATIKARLLRAVHVALPRWACQIHAAVGVILPDILLQEIVDDDARGLGARGARHSRESRCSLVIPTLPWNPPVTFLTTGCQGSSSLGLDMTPPSVGGAMSMLSWLTEALWQWYRTLCFSDIPPSVSAVL